MNVFHWHLTDDQGWRIEIKKYPRLAEVGAYRAETLHGYYDIACRGNGVPHEGYYTQEDVRDIVAYAEARHINVVPEIEMPGHCQAALAAYPEFGCRKDPYKVSTRWGLEEKAIFSPSDAGLSFLKDVLREVIALFPSPYVHIGGDEVPGSEWDHNEAVQEQMAALGLRNSREMQGYFISLMRDFLAEQGKILVGWDEILENGCIEGVAVMCWRGTKGGVVAANQGLDVIMAPDSHAYFNFYQSENTELEPLAMSGPYIDLAKVYEYEPISSEILGERGKHVLGVQGQLWGEYLAESWLVEYMALPRLCALAELAWSALEQREYKCFLQRLKVHLKRLDVLGVRYRGLDA